MFLHHCQKPPSIHPLNSDLTSGNNQITVTFESPGISWRLPLSTRFNKHPFRRRRGEGREEGKRKKGKRVGGDRRRGEERAEEKGRGEISKHAQTHRNDLKPSLPIRCLKVLSLQSNHFSPPGSLGAVYRPEVLPCRRWWRQDLELPATLLLFNLSSQ